MFSPESLFTLLKKSRDFFSVTCENGGMKRYLSDLIESFSNSKVVLLAGPRQVGKTTLGKQWLSKYTGLYLTWDAIEDRQQILKRTFLQDQSLEAILFDEIHKYRVWKGYLKGLFDKERGRLRLLVTGSARLDLYQKSGER